MADLTPVQVQLPFQLIVKGPECWKYQINVNRELSHLQAFENGYEVIHITILHTELVLSEKIYSGIETDVNLYLFNDTTTLDPK